MRFKTFENARCVICNKVSHEEIASDFGNQFQGSFRQDKSGDFLCSDCLGPIQDVMTEWYIDDELKEKENE